MSLGRNKIITRNVGRVRLKKSEHVEALVITFLNTICYQRALGNCTPRVIDLLLDETPTTPSCSSTKQCKSMWTKATPEEIDKMDDSLPLYIMGVDNDPLTYRIARALKKVKHVLDQRSSGVSRGQILDQRSSGSLGERVLDQRSSGQVQDQRTRQKNKSASTNVSIQLQVDFGITPRRRRNRVNETRHNRRTKRVEAMWANRRKSSIGDNNNKHPKNQVNQQGKKQGKNQGIWSWATGFLGPSSSPSSTTTTTTTTTISSSRNTMWEESWLGYIDNEDDNENDGDNVHTSPKIMDRYSWEEAVKFAESEASATLSGSLPKSIPLLKHSMRDSLRHDEYEKIYEVVLEELKERAVEDDALCQDVWERWILEISFTPFDKEEGVYICENDSKHVAQLCRLMTLYLISVRPTLPPLTTSEWVTCWPLCIHVREEDSSLSSHCLNDSDSFQSECSSEEEEQEGELLMGKEDMMVQEYDGDNEEEGWVMKNEEEEEEKEEEEEPDIFNLESTWFLDSKGSKGSRNEKKSKNEKSSTKSPWHSMSSSACSPPSTFDLGKQFLKEFMSSTHHPS